jgi:hypothetical protein
MRATTATRFIAALALMALAAGTVLASDPSPSASDSASASPSGDLVSSAPSAAPETTEPSAETSAPESSAPSAAPDPLKETQAPEASEAPEGSEAPDADESDGPPTAAEAADIVARLKAAGITTTDSAFLALAAKVGTGGAVRTLAFANASGKTPAQILAMFEGGMGWGQIDHELGLSIGPGIGWIMGHGHGNGNGNGKGHDKSKEHGPAAGASEAPGVTK